MNNSCEETRRDGKVNCGETSHSDNRRKRKWHVRKLNIKCKVKIKNGFSSEYNNCGSNNEGTGDNKAADEEIEIPGFYYDKEKKKYFRILPDQNSAVSGIITHEVLRERRIEEKRQKDLFLYSVPLAVTSKQKGKKPTCLTSRNSYHINTARGVGLLSPLHSESVFRECYIKQLHPRAKIAVSDPRGDESIQGEVEDVKKMILSPDATTLVCMWSVKDLTSQQLRKMHIKPTRRLDSEGNIALKTSVSYPSQQLGIMKIMSLCWAPRPDEVGHTSHVLLTCTSLLENAKNVACLANLDSVEEGNCSYFTLGQTSWSCAWNPMGNQFAVGLETHCVLVDVETKKKSKLYNDNSTIYTMAISNQSSRTMYSGTRKGNIFTHDLRSHFARSISDMNHKFGIAHIYLGSDEVSLTVSDVSGMIKTWDLRQRKVVKEFPGHINQYVRQPFFVDPAENFLFAAGQDCYTRIWNYQSGSLLHTIPAPHPVSVQSIPQIAYSDQMGGPPGLPGLLLTSKGEFHFYTF